MLYLLITINLIFNALVLILITKVLSIKHKDLIPKYINSKLKTKVYITNTKDYEEELKN